MTAGWVRRDDVLWRVAGDQLVLLPPGDQDAVTVSGPGVAIWELLAEPSELDDLVAALTARYAEQPARIAADLRRLLRELNRCHVIRYVVQ